MYVVPITNLQSAWSASPAASLSRQPTPRADRHNTWRNAAMPADNNGVLGTTYARSRRSSVIVQSVSSGGAAMASPSSPDDGASPTIPIGVVAVLSAAFLNLLGFTMAGPITPALGQHFGLEVGAKFGSLTSAYHIHWECSSAYSFGLGTAIAAVGSRSWPCRCWEVLLVCRCSPTPSSPTGRFLFSWHRGS